MIRPWAGKALTDEKAVLKSEGWVGWETEIQRGELGHFITFTLIQACLQLPLILHPSESFSLTWNSPFKLLSLQSIVFSLRPCLPLWASFRIAYTSAYLGESARAAMTRYHRLGGFNNTNVFSHSWGGWMAEIRCHQNQFLSAFRGPPSSGAFTWSSLCLYVQISSCNQGSSHIRLGPTLMTSC